jgi:hypothetical protein
MNRHAAKRDSRRSSDEASAAAAKRSLEPREQAAVHFLLRLQRALEALCLSLDEVESRLEKILLGVKYFREQVSAGERFRLPPHPQLRQRRRRQAQHADACRVDVKLGSDGSAWVSIDGRAGFRLQPRHAAILHVLIGQGGKAAADGLGAWRRYDEIAAALDELCGGEHTVRNVIKSVDKLRAAMAAAGECDGLVETDGRGGVRFRLRLAMTRPTVARRAVA